MADRQFLRLNNRWALAYDHRQWIVQYRYSADGKPEAWRSLLFISSTRTILLRCLGEEGVMGNIAPDKRAALESLPETFKKWLEHHQNQEATDTLITDLAKPTDDSTVAQNDSIQLDLSLSWPIDRPSTPSPL